LANNEKIEIVGVEFHSVGAREFKKVQSEVRAEIDKVFASLRKEQEELKNNGTETEKLRSKKLHYMAAAAAQEKVVKSLQVAFEKESAARVLSKVETDKLTAKILREQATLQKFKNTINETSQALKKLGNGKEHAAGRTEALNKKTEAFNKKLDTLRTRGEQVKNAGDKLYKSFTEPMMEFAKMASDLSGMLRQTDNTFGENAEAVKAWSKDSSMNFGQVQSDILKAANAYGVLGLDADASMKAVARAVDIASANNADFKDVQQDIEAALNGSTSALEKYGVKLGDAELAQYMVESGMAATSIEALNLMNAMNEAEKQALYYEKIMNDTASAQGDFANNAGDYAKQQDILKASLSDLSTELGAAVLPILEKVNEVLIDFIKWFKDAPDWLKTTIGIIAGLLVVLGPILIVIGSIITAVTAIAGSFLAIPLLIIGIIAAIYIFRDQISGIFDFVLGLFDNAEDWLTSALGPFGEVINQIFLEPIKGAIKAVQKVFDGVINFIEGVFTGDWEKAWLGVQQIFGGIFDGLVNLIKAPINKMISLINLAIAGLNQISIKIPDWVPFIGGKQFAVNIPKIPYLKHGAILSKATLNVAGEAGKEAIVPMTNASVQQELARFIVEGMNGLDFSRQGNSDVPVNVVVNLDGHTVGTLVQPSINSANTKAFNLARRSNLYAR